MRTFRSTGSGSNRRLSFTFVFKRCERDFKCEKRDNATVIEFLNYIRRCANYVTRERHTRYRS